jgi:hypothetical protein
MKKKRKQSKKTTSPVKTTVNSQRQSEKLEKQSKNRDKLEKNLQIVTLDKPNTPKDVSSTPKEVKSTLDKVEFTEKSTELKLDILPESKLTSRTSKSRTHNTKKFKGRNRGREQTLRIQNNHKNYVKNHRPKTVKPEIQLYDISLSVNTQGSLPVDTELKITSSRSELTDKQSDILDIARIKARNKAKQKVNSFKRKRFILRQLSKQKINPNSVMKLSLTMIIVVTLVFISEYIINNTVELQTMAKMNNCENVINVGIDSNSYKITCDIDEISIKNKNDTYTELRDNSWIKSSVDTKGDSYTIDNVEYTLSKELKLSAFDITNNMVYMQYKNIEGTAEKEMILADDKPNTVDTRSLSKLNSRFKESSNQLQIKTTVNSYDDTFLMLAETISGNSLIDTSLKNEVISIESQIATFVGRNGTKINLEEVGSIDLDLINSIKGNYEITYNNVDNVLKIKDLTNNEDCIYISNVDNDILGTSASDFIATTDAKLYISSWYSDSESNEYKTVLVKSDCNLFMIKFMGINVETVEKDTLEQLGIDINNVEIKKVQRVMYTE